MEEEAITHPYLFHQELVLRHSGGFWPQKTKAKFGDDEIRKIDV